jgi:hypothetical protein
VLRALSLIFIEAEQFYSGEVLARSMEQELL